MGPYLPFCSLKYPSFGIAIACGWVQSALLGASTGWDFKDSVWGSVEVAISFLLGIGIFHLCSRIDSASHRHTGKWKEVFRRWLGGYSLPSQICSFRVRDRLQESNCHFCQRLGAYGRL